MGKYFENYSVGFSVYVIVIETTWEEGGGGGMPTNVRSSEIQLLMIYFLGGYLFTFTYCFLLPGFGYLFAACRN